MAHSFDWHGVIISARGDLTIGDEDAITAIMLKTPESSGAGARYAFAEFMVASEIESDSFPVPIVTEDDDEYTVQASFQQWRKLPRAFLPKWREALSAAESSPNGSTSPS